MTSLALEQTQVDSGQQLTVGDRVEDVVWLEERQRLDGREVAANRVTEEPGPAGAPQLSQLS